jgi:hypothetical protein
VFEADVCLLGSSVASLSSVQRDCCMHCSCCIYYGGRWCSSVLTSCCVVYCVCCAHSTPQVAGFEQHEDATMVDRVAKLVSDVSAKLEDAESKARLFNVSDTA